MRREVAGYHKETRMALMDDAELRLHRPNEERGEPLPAEEPSR